jgi:hypothetical protein
MLLPFLYVVLLYNVVGRHPRPHLPPGLLQRPPPSPRTRGWGSGRQSHALAPAQAGVRADVTLL